MTAELSVPARPAAEPDHPPQEDPAPNRAARYSRKALEGVKLMLGRQVLIQLFTFAGGIVLARTLTPEIFGIFGISMFLVNTLALFGDFGLAPSLVQRKAEVTEQDLQVAFTLQQGLLTAVAVAIWIAAPYFLRIYPDIGGSETVWLIRAMALVLFLQSWRSMSVLQMERHLNFRKIAGIEIAEAFSYQGLAVGLALAGFGVWSLVWATLTRGLLGTAMAFAASPWRVRFAWHSAKAKEILRFGMPFQIGKVLNKASGWLTPVLVGGMMGPEAVGFITWASANGRKPTLLMGAINRVAFPHFSRLQDAPELVKSTFDTYLVPLLAVFAVWAGLIAGTADVLIPFVFTDKWAPAIPLLVLFSAQLPLLGVAWLATNVLRATGRVVASSSITATSSAVEVVLATTLIGSLGVTVIPLAALAAVAASIVIKVRLLPFKFGYLLMVRLSQAALVAGLGTLTGWAILALDMPVLAALPTALATSSAVMGVTACVVWPAHLGTHLKNLLRAIPAPIAILGRAS